MKFVLIGGLALLVLGVASVAGWLLLTKTTLVPESIATAFDSPRSIMNTANANDLEFKRLVDQLPSGTLPPEKIDEFTRATEKSMRLIARAVLTEPWSESAALELGDAEKKEGDLLGPLSESETEGIRDRLMELPESQKMKLMSMVATGMKSNEFAREFLRFGHLQLPESSVPAEQIEMRRIELLRELNRLGANALLSAEKQSVDGQRSKEETDAFINKLYLPITADVEKLADDMHALAEKRYRITGSEDAGTGRVPEFDQLDEVFYYAKQARQKVFARIHVLKEAKSPIAEPLREFSIAMGEVDSARYGRKPSRVVVKEQAIEAEEMANRVREEERQMRIAKENQANEKRLQAEADAEKAKLAATTNQQQKKGAKNSAANETASNAPGSRFGPANPFGPSPGFGPARRTARSRRGNVPDANRPNSRSTGQPSGHSLGPGAGRGRRSPPPSPSFEGGVTIKMEGAGSIDTGKLSQRFSKELGGGVNCQIRNGNLTVRLQYTGDLNAVTKLVDFGEVVKTDEATRTLTVIPK